VHVVVAKIGKTGGVKPLQELCCCSSGVPFEENWAGWRRAREELLAATDGPKLGISSQLLLF
jgi:hypothetical protein